MDDLNHNCPDCHEVTRAPTEHRCGRTPQGTLPGHQPHKTYNVPVIERDGVRFLDWGSAVEDR